MASRRRPDRLDAVLWILAFALGASAVVAGFLWR